MKYYTNYECWNGVNIITGSEREEKAEERIDFFKS